MPSLNVLFLQGFHFSQRRSISVFASASAAAPPPDVDHLRRLPLPPPRPRRFAKFHKRRWSFVRLRSRCHLRSGSADEADNVHLLQKLHDRALAVSSPTWRLHSRVDLLCTLPYRRLANGRQLRLLSRTISKDEHGNQCGGNLGFHRHPGMVMSPAMKQTALAVFADTVRRPAHSPAQWCPTASRGPAPRSPQ